MGGMNGRRVEACLFELSANTRDVAVDIARVSVVLGFPNARKELLARVYFALLRCEQNEERVLGLGELDELPLNCDLSTLEIDRKRPA